MRVDHAEIEFAGDQENNRPEGGHPIEASSAALGGLEQTVEGVEEGIGLAAFAHATMTSSW